MSSEEAPRVEGLRPNLEYRRLGQHSWARGLSLQVGVPGSIRIPKQTLC